MFPYMAYSLRHNIPAGVATDDSRQESSEGRKAYLVSPIVHAPVAELIQKVTGRHSQIIDVIEGHFSVTHDGTVE